MNQRFQNAQETFYIRLALYEALTGDQAEHERRPAARPKGDESCEVRRDFLDSFAYLCDIKKGGATVTAAGLQKLQLSNILWLASNEGIESSVLSYAKDLLRLLIDMKPESEAEVREEVFRRAVQICSLRLQAYNGELQSYAKRCRMELKKELRDDTVRALRRKLKKLSEPPASFTIAQIVDLCYKMRGHEVDAIKKRSTQHPDFGKLAHYIGRLGATRSSSNSVVKAMVRVPALRQLSDIRHIKEPEVQTIVINTEHASPYEIVRAISNDSASQNILDIQKALHKLIDLDPPTADSTRSPIRAKLASRKEIKARVHAELQITDRFSREKYEFVDGDKYIGCSKPACYFCYNWLLNHHHFYAQPATHSRVILGCRGADHNLNESGARVLKEMYSKMNLRVGQDITDFLLHVREDEAAGREPHYMSTEGTSRATSIV